MTPEDGPAPHQVKQARRVACLGGFCVLAPLCAGVLLFVGVRKLPPAHGQVPHGTPSGSNEELRWQLAQETRRADEAEAKLASIEEELKRAKASEAAHDEGDANSTAELQEERAVSARLRAELAEAERRARAAEQAAAGHKANQTSEDSSAEGPGPVIEWFRSWYHKYSLALLVGTAGVLGVAGPSIFVRLFAPTAGSLLGGLCAASCFAFLAAAAVGGAGSSCWLDSAGALASGSGTVLDYLLWGSVTLFGLLRWLFQWDCLLYAKVGDLDLDEAPPLEEAGGLREPLLQSLAEAPWLASLRGWGDKVSAGKSGGQPVREDPVEGGAAHALEGEDAEDPQDSEHSDEEGSESAGKGGAAAPVAVSFADEQLSDRSSSDRYGHSGTEDAGARSAHAEVRTMARDLV